MSDPAEASQSPGATREASAVVAGARADASTRRAVLAAGCIAIVLGVVALPMWRGEIRLDSDLRTFYLPFRHFYAECLARGQSFLWYPHEYNGFYLHGEGQLGLYHPLNWLSYAWLPFPIAFDLELLRAFVFMLGGSAWLAHRLGLPRDAACLAAALSAFSGFQIAHFVHLNALNIVAHLPFALLAIEGALRGKRPGRVAGSLAALALLSASQLHLGHPQFTWLCWLVEGIYAATRARALAALPRLAGLLAAQLLAVLLAGVAVVPQWASFQESARADPPPDLAYRFALPPERLGEIVSPWLFQVQPEAQGSAEYAAYDGAVPLVLLAWLFVRRRELGARRPVIMLLAGVAALALLLSLGRAGLLYSLHTLLPGVGWFRAPARYLLLVHLALAALAAVAFADLARVAAARRARPWRELLPLAIPFGVSACVAIAATLAPRGMALETTRSVLSPPALAWIGPAILAVATLLVAIAARGRPGAVSAVLVLAIADLGAYAVVVLERVPSASVESTVARWEVPDWSDHYRVEWAPPELTLRGVRMSEGYAGMQPRRRLRAPEGAKDDPVDAAFIQAMRVANVRRAYEVDIPAPLPRARLLTRAVTAEGDLRRQLARLDVERIAVVDRAIDLPSGLPGRARIVEESPGRLRLETRALTRQLLVLAESFHPGWRARVDAAPCDVVRVYGDFMGCVVPAGTHRVAFDFEPRSLRVGIALSLLGLVALGPLCVLAAHQARARGNVTS